MTVIGNGEERQLVITTGTQVYEGYIMTKDTGNTLKTALATAEDAAMVGIALKKTVDGNGNARVTRAGETVAIALLGCGKVVQVASIAGQTYTTGLAVYASSSDGSGVDGQCADSDDKSGSGATKIGHYVGAGEASVSAGTLIDVMLDVANKG